jgi:hypothetical protein
MIRVELFFGVLAFALCVYCLIDVIGRDGGDIRNLPKVWWIVLVLLFPLAGSIAWLVAGRPREPRRSAYERPVTRFPEYDRPGRAAATSPEDDEAFLRSVRERAEEQRRAHRQAQREEQRQEEQERRRSSQPEQQPGADED